MKAERIASRFSISHRDAELFVHGLSERSSCALDSVLVALVPEFNLLGQYDQVVAFIGRGFFVSELDTWELFSFP